MVLSLSLTYYFADQEAVVPAVGLAVNSLPGLLGKWKNPPTIMYCTLYSVRKFWRISLYVYVFSIL